MTHGSPELDEDAAKLEAMGLDPGPTFEDIFGVTPCIGNDPQCPCQDGDACHYVDLPGSPAMVPRDHFITLKTWPEYWDAVADGRKPFEVRKADRPYHVGAVLLLQRWEPDRGDFTYDDTGHPLTLARRVTFLLPGGQFGIEPGYVAMGVQDVTGN